VYLEGDEEEIAGVYVAHWELPSFMPDTLASRRERWLPRFPPEFHLPPAPVPRGPARFFRMTFRGRVGPRGVFGHMGMCEREVLVSRVVACEPTTDPGATRR
jgi:hypothetical protein